MNGEFTFIQQIFVQGGFAALFFLVWYFTFKHAKTQQKEAADILHKQFSDTLSQAQSQFENVLKQNQTQHSEAMAMNQKTLDKIFSLWTEDIKYKALLAETLTQLKIKIDLYRRSKDGE
jgi:hypothetical protein